MTNKKYMSNIRLDIERTVTFSTRRKISPTPTSQAFI